MFDSRFDWNFWLWWVLLTSIGSTAAMFALVFIVFNLGIPVLDSGPDPAAPSLAQQMAAAPLFALAGAIAGTFQWLTLRTLLPQAGWWVLASALGWAAGYLSTLVVPPPSAGQVSFATAALAPWLAIGLATGLAQWLFLRRRLSSSGWWVLASALAVVTGAAGWIFGSVIGGALSWAAAGALTGYVLLYLWQSNH